MITIERHIPKFQYPHLEVLINQEDIKELMTDSTTGYFMNIHLNNESPKVSELKDKIYRFKELSYDWDSYNAEKITKNSISRAIQVMKLLESNNIILDHAFPMRDGGIQLEKDTQYFDIEIEVHNDDEIDLLIFDKDANVKLEKQYNTYNLNEEFIRDIAEFN